MDNAPYPGTISHYRILGRIGEGGMGVLYRAEDTRLGRIVALKVLPDHLADDPAAAQRLLREAQAASRITHPNICPIFDVDLADKGTRFIAMALIDGATLRDRIREGMARGALMSPADVASIARQIAAALNAAHALQIIHRDIKSENIMIDESGHVTVMDFGLALVRTEARLTRTSTLLGTIAYMAPEVLQGGEPDQRSDLFSLGVVLYELLCGRLPFRGVHEAAMIYSIINEEPASLRKFRNDLPSSLVAVVDRLLQKDSMRRFGSAAELRDALAGTEPRAMSRESAIVPPSSTQLSPTSTTTIGGSPLTTELRIYISGLEGLSDERDHLVRRVIPELRLLCRARGISLSIVDLSSELSERQGAIALWLHSAFMQIDRARPRFIGLLHDTIGPVPELRDLYEHSDLLSLHPWIEDAVLEGAGATELEIRYAAMEGGREKKENEGEIREMRFFVRRGTGAENGGSDDPARVRPRRLMEELRSFGYRIEEYRNAIALGELIHDMVMEIVEQDFPEVDASAVMLERRRHQTFAHSRRIAYVPDPGHLAAIKSYIATGSTPLVVTGPSGAGKSSLVSYWAEGYRRRHPDHFVLEHYVAVGRSADQGSVLSHLLNECGERFGQDTRIPPTRDAMARMLLNRLSRNESLSVVIIDGLDHLSDDDPSLDWLPLSLPESLRIILTVADESRSALLIDRNYPRLAIDALNPADRRTIIARFIAERHLPLAPESINRIVDHPRSSLQLFLRTLLEEISLVDPGRRKRALDRYLRAQDVPSLFQLVLERLEDDHGTRGVRETMSYIMSSTEGMSEADLVAVSGLSRSSIASLIAPLDYHLIERNGRIAFFHSHLRQAVESRYMQSAGRRRETHETLAKYFAEIVDDELKRNAPESIATPGRLAQGAAELLSQLWNAGDRGALVKRLSSIPFFAALFHGESLYLILRAWRGLDEVDIVQAYRSSLEEWEKEERGSEERRDVLQRLSRLFEMVGRIDDSLEMCDRLLTIANESSDPHHLAEAEVRVGWLSHLRGDRDAAIEHTRHALVLAESIDDRRTMASAIGNMGVMYRARGEYQKALECYRRQYDLAERLGDSLLRCNAVGNMGAAYLYSGDLEQALEQITHQRSIAREIHDRQSLSMAIGNLGIVHLHRGDLDRALESFNEQLAIDQELGDRKGIAMTLDNIGAIHSQRGEYGKALGYHERSRRLAEEIGFTSALYTAVGNSGISLAELGRHDEALAALHQAIEGHRRLGYREELAVWLHEAAKVLEQLATDSSIDSMPEWLASYLDDPDNSDWKSKAMQKVEEYRKEID